jgi:hypothetical protein
MEDIREEIAHAVEYYQQNMPKEILDQLPSAAPPKGGVDPLDKIIAEQAAYYGMTREKFARTMSDLASFQEKIEACDLNYLDLY